jgi:hypothetical protein
VQEKRRRGLAKKWADAGWKAKHLAEMREALKGVDHRAKGRKAAVAWNPEKKAEHAQRLRRIKTEKPVVISDEQRKQISETLKAKYAAGEIVSPMKGKTASDQTRAKQSLAAKHRKRGPLSEATKAKIAAANRGRRRHPLSEEHKQKIAAGMRRYRRTEAP